MRPITYAHSRSGSRDGVALIMVLAFVVLLSILIVSLIAFTRLNRVAAASYSKTVQAQEIAQGGLQDVLGDLRSEIIAGSIVYTNNPSGTGYTNSYAAVYVPITNYTAAPARFGYAASSWTNAFSATALPPTLVRVSRASQDGTPTDLYPALNTASYYTNMGAVTGGAILNRASAANSTTTSVNGFFIPATRWNKTFLLAATLLTNGAPAPAEQIPTPFVTDTPDWVYVTRTGSRVCQVSELSSLEPSINITNAYTITAGANPPASPVVGRYAYIMYDEGALLDANVAGFVSNATNETANVPPISTPTTNNPAGLSQTVRNKSYLGYADLSQFVSSTTAAAAINSFVNWRNASYSPSANTTNYLNAVFNYAQNGFLSFQSGDSPLLSRQDLINYLINADPTVTTLVRGLPISTGFNTTSPGISLALPYLSTFSRAVSAPSWSPPLDASALGGWNTNAAGATVYAYHDNAEVSTGSPFTSTSPNPNRDLPNVRFQSAATITHYFDNATSTNYNVSVGDPLMQTRFSLAKIAWLSQANPNTGATPSATYATAIQACFGLSWGVKGNANGGNALWTYVGASGSNPVGSIETLDQVAAENREPNFFEVLKAAILSGSLGLGAGPCAWQNGSDLPFAFRDLGNYATYPGSEDLYIYSFDRAGTIPAPSRIPDAQIIQIGANIIDQFHADSWPTPILFAYTGIGAYDAATLGANPDPASFGESDVIYGIKNLPYLIGAYLIAGTVNETDTSGLDGWMQPQVWNPHQMPASYSTPQPTTYEIRAYGQATLAWSKEYTPPSPETSSGETTLPGGGQLDGNYIKLSTTTAGNQQFYATPLPTATTTSGVTVTAGGTFSSDMTAVSTMMDYAMNPFVAFWLGSDPTYIVDPDDNPTSGLPQKTKTNLVTSAGFSLALGWIDAGGGFHPYSFMPGMAGYSYGVIGLEKTSETPHANNGSAYPNHTGDDAHFLFDPRVNRFGTMFDWDSGEWATTFYPNAGYGGRHGDTYGWGAPFLSNFNWPGVNANGSDNGSYPQDWEVNQASPLTQTSAGPTYYSDPDGVIRPGDGLYGSTVTGDGMPLFTTTATPSGLTTYAIGDSGGNTQHARRPVILNRPFRNVGELGYTSRGLPFKTLDLFSKYSADAALLDVFSVTDEAKVSSTSQIYNVVAGEVDLNNAPVPIIYALLSGGAKKDLDPNYNMGAENPGSANSTASVGLAISRQLLPVNSGPLLNRAGLVSPLGPVIRAAFTASPDLNNKPYIESAVRALADVTNTRTWNLLIDIIAQSGHMSPTAKTLNDFVVDGEKRYWLHIAIDRYTGKIVDQQLEPVYE